METPEPKEKHKNMMKRPRRLRENELLRRAVRETRISPDSLIYPIFVVEGENICQEIPSLPGQKHYSPDRIKELVEESLNAGVSRFLLFGLPKHKDDEGSSAYDPEGVVQQALRILRKEFGQSIYLITDVCLCEFTSHGHCGHLEGHRVDNDATCQLLAKVALSHVQAGADMVAPSDMMDGRIKVLRQSLDDGGYAHIPIMSYAVKYASGFYGPFREAAGSAPAFGDRSGYQMDVHNSREALKEALLDVEEGADLLMVKPAMAFGDIIRQVKEATHLPLASYSVSGEYAMMKAAGACGAIDEEKVMIEAAVSAYRAGSDLYITYYAKELAQAMKANKLG